MELRQISSTLRMERMLKAEAKKILGGKFLILVLVCMTLISFLITTREAAMKYGLMTASEFIGYYEQQNINLVFAKGHAAVFWNIDRDWVDENIQEYYQLAMATHNEQFNRLLGVNLGMLVLAAFLGPYYIGMDFKTRVWNNALYVGKSRTKVFLSRMVGYYVIVSIISLIISFILISVYAGSIFSKLPALEIVLSLGRRLIVDWAIMSVPILFIFLFKGAVFPCIATIIVNITTWFAINKIWEPTAEVPLVMDAQAVTPLKPEQLPRMSLYSANFGIIIAVLAFCLVLAWIRFLYCDLD